MLKRFADFVGQKSIFGGGKSIRFTIVGFADVGHLIVGGGTAVGAGGITILFLN